MSSEHNVQKKRIVTDLKYPLPDVHISFEQQLDIIKAYAVASNNGKNPVSYKELEPFIKIEPNYVSGCNKFFQDLGLLSSPDKIGKYIPTEIALELYNGLKWKDDQLIKTTLQKILFNSWFWGHTRQYLEVNNSISRTDLIQKLGLVCDGDPKKHTSAIRRLIEYMQFAGLIKEDNEDIVLNTTQIKETRDLHQDNTVKQIIVNKQESFPVNNSDSILNPLNITLGIMINANMSEEEIRRTIRIVLDELKKNSEVGEK